MSKSSSLIYREIKFTDLPDIFRETCITTGVVMLLIAASSGLGWIMTVTNIPQSISAVFLQMSDNPVMILIVGWMLPFYAAMIAALLVVTYVPQASLWLPVQTKQLKESDIVEIKKRAEQPASAR